MDAPIPSAQAPMPGPVAVRAFLARPLFDSPPPRFTSAIGGRGAGALFPPITGLIREDTPPPPWWEVPPGPPPELPPPIEAPPELPPIAPPGSPGPPLKPPGGIEGVPEPGSWLLLSLGILAAAAGRKVARARSTKGD